MNCFPCFSSQKSKKSHSKREHGSPQQDNVTSRTPDDGNPVENANIKAQTYTFRELATATKNFRQECLLGEGGFGRVYKGTIPATGQVVAVKQLDRNGMQGNKDFLAEVLALSHLNHENLVNLVGYCADGDQRLLVYEFMSGGSLEDRILDNKSNQPALDWFTRMKIASGAARGLEYLHDKANPPVVYRDLKSSNILLDNDLNPKLSDFGLAKLSGGDKMNLISPGVTGTYGYSAPEYVRTGHLSLKSDVYGFGVVLLELITGRRAIDTTRPNEEQNLISWAQPLFRDPKRFPDMADPLLGKHFPEKDLNQAVAIAAMCLQEEEAARPLMSDVVTALSFLSMVPPEVIPASLSPATSPPEESITSESEAETASDENEDGNGDCVCSSRRSGSVSSCKSSVNGNLSQKSSSTRERDLKKKSSRKSSVRVLSQKNSMGWEDESEISGNRLSQGNISIGLISSGESQGESVRLDRRSSSRRSQEGSIRLDHTNSAGSNKPNNVEQERISTKDDFTWH